MSRNGNKTTGIDAPYEVPPYPEVECKTDHSRYKLLNTNSMYP